MADRAVVLILSKFDIRPTPVGSEAFLPSMLKARLSHSTVTWTGASSIRRGAYDPRTRDSANRRLVQLPLPSADSVVDSATM